MSSFETPGVFRCWYTEVADAWCALERFLGQGLLIRSFTRRRFGGENWRHVFTVMWPFSKLNNFPVNNEVINPKKGVLCLLPSSEDGAPNHFRHLEFGGNDETQVEQPECIDVYRQRYQLHHVSPGHTVTQRFQDITGENMPPEWVRIPKVFSAEAGWIFDFCFSNFVVGTLHHSLSGQQNTAVLDWCSSSRETIVTIFRNMQLQMWQFLGE